MSSISMSNVLELSVTERLKLVELIWDSIAEFPEAIPLTDRQKEELDNRLEEYYKSPNENINWSDAKKMLLEKK
jgi:putative addiction module component (TIGR02574 family)